MSYESNDKPDMKFIANNVMVFAHEHNGRTSYSVCVSTAEQVNGQKTGEYARAYLYLQFPRGNAPKNGDKIDITDSFYKAYKTRDGGSGFVVMVKRNGWKLHGEKYEVNDDFWETV